MGIFRKKIDTTESDAAREHRLGLIDGLTFEVVPLKSLTGAMEHLPAGCEVPVTCSPAKGIEETQRITDELTERGYLAIPHISARMVRDRAHTAELAGWFRSTGIERIFIVGGDYEDAGDYPGAVEFLRDLLDTDHGLQTIGVTAYPDGHAFLSDEIVRNALAD